MLSPRTLFLLFLLLLMELLAGFTVAVGSSLLDATSLQYAMFWLLILSGVLGLAAALLIAGLHWSARGNRVGLVLAGAVATVVPALLVSRGAVSFLASVLLLALAYWRGTKVTEEPPLYEEAQRRFSSGFGLLFLGILWVIARGIFFQRPIWQMLAFVGIAYIVTGMLALGVARLEQIREPGALQMVVLAVTLQLGFLAIAGFAALELFSLDIVGWLGHVTQPLWDAFGRAGSAAISPLVSLAQWLVTLVRPHAHTVHHPTAYQPGVAPHGNGKRLRTHPAQSVWFTVLGIAFVIAVLATVAILIWRTIPRLPQRRTVRAFTEERRSIWSVAALWEMLATWLRALLRRSRAAAGEAVQATRRRVLGPEYPSDPVRRIYAQLLHRAQSAGVPRASFATPTEFQWTMARRWPAAATDFAALTDAYILRRYGDVSFDQQQVLELVQCWRRLRRAMHRAPAVAPAEQPADQKERSPWEPVPSGPPVTQFGALSGMRAALRRWLSFQVLSRRLQRAGIRVLVGILFVIAPIIVFILLVTVIWRA